jgi:hypothetical protein
MRIAERREFCSVPPLDELSMHSNFRKLVRLLTPAANKTPPMRWKSPGGKSQRHWVRRVIDFDRSGFLWLFLLIYEKTDEVHPAAEGTISPMPPRPTSTIHTNPLTSTWPTMSPLLTNIRSATHGLLGDFTPRETHRKIPSCISPGPTLNIESV